jgi:DNA polymerase (family 10)
MKNQEIAQLFDDIAKLLELKGENVFRVLAYQRAGQTIDGLPTEVATLSDEELIALPGIGKDLAGKIREYLATGRIAKYDELTREIPAGVLELLRVPGIGPKKAKQFFEKLKIAGIDDLEAAIKEGRLRTLPGIQDRTEQNLLKSIDLARRFRERTKVSS